MFGRGCIRVKLGPLKILIPNFFKLFALKIVHSVLYLTRSETLRLHLTCVASFDKRTFQVERLSLQKHNYKNKLF